MTAAVADVVRILDLTRDSTAEAYLDVIDARKAGPLGLPRRVVVIDDVTKLIEHYQRYERLAALPQVEKVICVAIGGLDGARTEFQIPTAMVTVAATLWVGDRDGVNWSGGADRARVRGQEKDTDLSDLISVLRTPEVFDEVYRRTRDFPHQTASPGLDVDRIDVPEQVLTDRRVVALRSIVATGLAAREQEAGSRLTEVLDRVATQMSGARNRVLDQVPVEALLQQVRTGAHIQLRRAHSALQRLASLAGLLGAHGGVRHTKSLLATAGSALYEHQALATETVRRVGANLASGYPPVHELVEIGLPQPSGVDHVALSSEVGAAVSADLRAGHPLPDISGQLRRFAVRVAPQGAIGAGRTISSSRVESLTTVLKKPPPVTFGWPAPLVLLTGIAFLTCFAATMLPQPSGIAGPVLSLCWIVLTGLLLARRSGQNGVKAMAFAVDWGLIAVGAAAVAGVVSGALASQSVDTSGLPVEAEFLAVLLLVLVMLGTGALSWNWMIHSWSRKVGLQEALDANQYLVQLLDEVIAAEWRPAQQRRQLADTALAVASGIDDVAELATELLTVLEEVESGGGAEAEFPSAAGLGGGRELVAVLRRDLAELTILAIEPCLAGIRRAGPQSAQPGQYADHTRHLFTDYSGHLETRGVHALPAGIRDEAPRQALRAALWHQSDASRQILRSNHRSELIQLCAAGEVRLLNAADSEVFRFAPQDARDVLAADDVIWVSGTAVGVVRLVPLRPGLVEITPIACKGQDAESTAVDVGKTATGDHHDAS